MSVTTDKKIKTILFTIKGVPYLQLAIKYTKENKLFVITHIYS